MLCGALVVAGIVVWATRDEAARRGQRPGATAEPEPPAKAKPAPRSLAVAGVVVDSGGFGVANAWVAPNTLTDRDGAFRIEGLPAGEYELRVAKDGYATVKRRVQAGDEDARIVLQRPATLSGTVTGDDGKPVADLVVSICNSQTTRTDKNGKFRFDDVAPGYIFLRAGRVLDSFDLPEGEHKVIVLDFRERGSVIRLRVLDPGGHPVRDAAVDVAEVGSAVTDINGRVYVEIGQPWGNRFAVTVTPHERDRPLMAGRALTVKSTSGAERIETDVQLNKSVPVRIHAVDPDGNALAATITTTPATGVRGSDLYHMDPRLPYYVDARCEGWERETRSRWIPGSHNALKLTLHRPGVITGRVVDRAGEPVKHALAWLSRRAWVTKRDGRFRFDKVGGGTRTVYLTKSGFAARASAEVKLGDTVDVGDIVLEPVLALKGRIVDEAGRPAGGVGIDFRPRCDALACATSSRADGTFELAVPNFPDFFLHLRKEGKATIAVPIPLPPGDIVLPLPERLTVHVSPDVVGSYWFVVSQIVGKRRYEIAQVGAGSWLEIDVPPGKLHVRVFGPRDDYGETEVEVQTGRKARATIGLRR